MSAIDGGVTRRQAIVMSSAVAVGATLPSWPLAAAEIVETPSRADAFFMRCFRCPGNLTRSRADFCRDLFAEAAALYEATGDGEFLERARWTLYFKLGFLMQLTPEKPEEVEAQIVGFQVLEAAVAAYPEVPCKVGLPAAVERYRRRGCGEGRPLW